MGEHSRSFGSVVPRNQTIPDAKLSIGWYPPVAGTQNNASTSAASSTAPVTTASTAASTTATTTAAATHTAWELGSDNQTYQRYNNSSWEWEFYTPPAP